MPVICNVIDCGKPATLKRPKTGDALCKECFFFAFETEIHVTIVKANLFKHGYKVAIGASGGKDSTVLAYVLKLLNERYNYGLDLFLLSIDEGITGYRDDSLETVKQNRDDYQMPLKILSYKDLYGWTMDEIVAQIGHKNNCTFCGVFRRQALDRGAQMLNADMIVTGHNADDVAETVIMNVLRGDVARLSRCTNIITEGEGTIPRCKPLKYVYEKEIVMYAHYKGLVYFSTECIYSPNAYRGYTREYIKEIERIRPSCILDIIHSGEIMVLKKSVKIPKRGTCTRCGFVASQEICKACVLLEGLNTGMPKLGIGKSNKARKIMGLKVNDGSENKTKEKGHKTESKRKIKRENKKKSTCEEGCASDCKSKNYESTLADDIDVSRLSLEENSTEEQKASTVEDFLFSILNESSDEEISDIQIKPKKEKIECKCPPRLRVNTKSKQLDVINDTDSSSDDDIFDFEAFVKLLGINNSSVLDKETESALINDALSNTSDKQLISNTELQNPSSRPFEQLHSTNESLPLSSTVLSDYLDADRPQLSSSLMQESQCSKLLSTDNINNVQSLLKTETSQHSSSQLINCLENIEQLNLSNELPSIVKANPKKLKPSLTLPQMMYKAKNNLDF
ncbi:PREDICTED: cytoplasmic tRNA 2-thiolation protein 1 [Ceratosolen solmsi marchali]|uniref:Cytoplasmic tRNA 2-thiolation protein 1 n=1 Tax=Ceratosolen solmsi marchali TaxID=326594 RepID=A0AAJ7DXX6_9HYME|nr:PREDICTED: cytoplasmic tRNA 2-thiolation protein 1 [Ceratosolen solmsi marchali]